MACSLRECRERAIDFVINVSHSQRQKHNQEFYQSDCSETSVLEVMSENSEHLK